ncbi:MAG: hypothetical protein Q9162_007637 [Coniocarpon cinnabarinum]
MTSIGTGYDLANSTFSPDGRNFQVEYAIKAVENGGTAIGIRCKDGVVLAVEKLVTSKLSKPGANKRIATIDRNMGIAYSGLLPDGRHLTQRAREETAEWRSIYKTPMPVSSLADRLGYYVSVFTLYASVRPFGITAIVAGWDAEDTEASRVDGEVGSGPKTGTAGALSPDADEAHDLRRGGPGLYMIEPSGMYWGYYGAATGKGRQSAKAELEKLELNEGRLSLEEGVKEAAKIILIAHEDNKDKEFEVEMTWVGRRTGGRHEEVPEGTRKEAEEWAKRVIEGDEEEEGMQE